jgi:ABC-type iron transport system FetAB ATPase subunit
MRALRTRPDFLLMPESAHLVLEQIAIGALTAVDLNVAAGEIVCLSGASGSGKTRLLRAVADLEPHAGRVKLGGTERESVPAHEWRRRVMLVPAESQWWADTVGEHFCRPMTEALVELDLPAEARGWMVARLSSGEKQRLALIRAASSWPAALLLDEPTANLDVTSTKRVERWLTDLIRTQQLPAIWVAHDAGQISRVADRHLVIRDRHLVAA